MAAPEQPACLRDFCGQIAFRIIVCVRRGGLERLTLHSLFGGFQAVMHIELVSQVLFRFAGIADSYCRCEELAITSRAGGHRWNFARILYDHEAALSVGCDILNMQRWAAAQVHVEQLRSGIVAGSRRELKTELTVAAREEPAYRRHQDT